MRRELASAVICIVSLPSDVSVLYGIVREAAARRRPSPAAPLSLLEVLKSYDFVLRSHCMAPEKDTFYYRVLLKLSHSGAWDWLDRLDAMVQVPTSIFRLLVA